MEPLAVLVLKGLPPHPYPLPRRGEGDELSLAPRFEGRIEPLAVLVLMGSPPHP
jgi:hypothetical protein